MRPAMPASPLSREAGAFAAVPDVPSLPPRPSSQVLAGATGPQFVTPEPSSSDATNAVSALWSSKLVYVGIAVVAFVVVGGVAFVGMQALFGPQAPSDSATTMAESDSAAAASDEPVRRDPTAPVASSVTVVVDAGSVAAVDGGVDTTDPAASGGGAVAAPSSSASSGAEAATQGSAGGASTQGASNGPGVGAVDASLVTVRAPQAGRVAKLLVSPRDSVDVGTALVVFEVERGASRRLQALRREEAEFVGVEDPRAREELNAIRAEIRRLEEQTKSTLTVVADVAGVVGEVLAAPGDAVGAKAPLLRLVPRAR